MACRLVVLWAGCDECDRDFHSCLGDPKPNSGSNNPATLAKAWMSGEWKFVLDVALVALIILLVWTRWHHNRPDKHDNEPC